MGTPARPTPPYLRPRVGRVLVPAQCRTPPGLGWGCVRGAQGAEDWALSPNTSLSCPLLGPHLPRGAPGSVRPSPPQQLPGLRPRPRRRAAGAGPLPCFWTTNSAAPLTAAPNPRGRRRRSPAGPAPGAAASFRPRSRPGRGRCVLLRVARREDLPPAQVRLLKGARVSGPFGEAGNLNPNPAHPLGREIPTDCPSGEETKVQREK